MTKDEALQVVGKLLDRSNKQDGGDLVINNIADAGAHWIISWDSARFLEGGDINFALTGNSPYAIEKATGRVDHDFITSGGIEFPSLDD